MAELGFSKTQGKKGNGSRAATPAQVTEMVMVEARKRGLNWFKPHMAAGMVGSFIQETGNFRNDVINFNVRGDNGSAHGLMQWRGKRYTNLLAYAKQSNANPADIRTQVSFAIEEGMPNSRFKDFGTVKAFRLFPQTKNVGESATAFVHAERPAGYDGNARNAHDVQKRINHASSAYNSYDGASPEQRQSQENRVAIPGNYDGSAGGSTDAAATVPSSYQAGSYGGAGQTNSNDFGATSPELNGIGGQGYDQQQEQRAAGQAPAQPNPLDPLGIIAFAERDNLNPFTRNNSQRSLSAFGA